MKHLLYLILFIIITSPVFGQTYYTFEGTVRDSSSCKPIQEVSVFLKNDDIGTMTNENGQYILYLEKGAHQVEFKVKGYQNYTVQFYLNGDLDFDILMVSKESKREGLLHSFVSKFKKEKEPVLYSENTNTNK